jgi:hypothetical protein
VYFDGILKIIITVSFIFYFKKITIYNSLNATTMTKKKKRQIFSKQTVTLGNIFYMGANALILWRHALVDTP